MTMSATYSPEDNKLRLYASTRLDAETYARVKAAGFKWAPQQGLFVAPMWTPYRADLLIELAGEIDDEDTSLVDRAEERAERFEEYQDSRTADAHAAREAVARIADNIPFGQPILVGHHSERHARKDAERIENGMRKAVRMWETAAYWEQRAAGAIRHAKYKERPDVRARRIKTIEADKRKAEKTRKENETYLRLWQKCAETTEPEKQRAQALHIANVDYISREFPLADFPRDPPASQYEGRMSLWSALSDGVITAAQACEIATRAHARWLPGGDRWIQHYENRLAYERAMLAASGGTVTDRTGPEQGGACRCWASPGHGRGWAYIQKVNKVTVTVLDNWGNGGGNFRRTIPFDKLHGVMTAAQVTEARAAGRIAETPDKVGFYLREAPDDDTKPETRAEANDRVHAEHVAAREPVTPAADLFDAMKQSLKAGVQVVSAPQLFPTPPDLARRMVELADIKAGHEVLEPSAGTGAILDAIDAAQPAARVVAIEINPTLGGRLDATTRAVVVGDFLKCETQTIWGPFARIVMNPPFENGSDIRHIEHAARMLKPGGRLVAICANGPRQQERLKPLAIYYQALPAGTFAGTDVNAALLIIEKDTE